jgi:SAM-dependent methyltransferase
MGRWSRLLAPLFIEFVGGINEGEHVLDVGCGTGSLSFTIARTTRASKIVGIDPSVEFVEYARAHNQDPRVTFEVGDAQDLPYPDGFFDKCLALLIMSFVPDAATAAREMRRVTRAGGVVATSMWDNTGGMQLHQIFWDVAVALNPEAERLHLRHRPYGSAEAFSDLWCASGLKNIDVRALAIPLEFGSFDEVWVGHANGEGPAGAYTRSLSRDRQQALKERLRRDILGSRPDGPFTLNAKAWAVRGLVPVK